MGNKHLGIYGLVVLLMGLPSCTDHREGDTDDPPNGAKRRQGTAFQDDVPAEPAPQEQPAVAAEPGKCDPASAAPDTRPAERLAPGELSGEIRMSGSSTVYPISAGVAEEFWRQNPGVRFSVSSTGTGGGFKNFFIPGKTQINSASRPIKDSELEQCRENGIEVIEMQVGIYALPIVCDPTADWVDSMTFAQLKRIWGSGDAPRRWNEVDASWPEAEFELYGPVPTSGTFDYFTEVVIGEEDAHRGDYTKSEHDNMLVEGIAGDKHALGYLGFAYYVNNQDKLKALAIAKTADDEPVKPSLDNAQSGAYPLSRPLFIYVNKNALEKPHVKTFVEFYIRQSATDLVSNEGYVPITEEQMKENLAKIGAD